jgi:hypothetical protein
MKKLVFIALTAHVAPEIQAATFRVPSPADPNKSRLERMQLGSEGRAARHIRNEKG